MLPKTHCCPPCSAWASPTPTPSPAALNKAHRNHINNLRSTISIDPLSFTQLTFLHQLEANSQPPLQIETKASTADASHTSPHHNGYSPYHDRHNNSYGDHDAHTQVGMECTGPQCPMGGKRSHKKLLQPVRVQRVFKVPRLASLLDQSPGLRAVGVMAAPKGGPASFPYLLAHEAHVGGCLVPTVTQSHTSAGTAGAAKGAKARCAVVHSLLVQASLVALRAVLQPVVWALLWLMLMLPVVVRAFML